MDDRHELREEDAAADQAQSTASANETRKVGDRRIERLQDLLADALKESDPLRASLRAAAADLLEIGYRLGVGIKAAMGSESTDLETCAAVMPAISSMALVHRQATRYIQLDQSRAADDDSA